MPCVCVPPLAPIRIVIDETISFDAADANEAEMFLACAGVERPATMLAALQRWGKFETGEVALALRTRGTGNGRSVGIRRKPINHYDEIIPKTAQARRPLFFP